MAEITAHCSDGAMLECGPTQRNIPCDYFYAVDDYEISKPIGIRRGSRSAQAVTEVARLLADATFPVIVAGGGVIGAGAGEGSAALAERLGAPVVTSYLHNDSFPANHPLWAGPLGYRGSKAAMRLIARADVVLAPGTRPGPFGTLPQHGIDYWRARLPAFPPRFRTSPAV
ncbi:MAG: hypothetical protein ACREFP_27355 [Acetobacteraceae bacterium]